MRVSILGGSGYVGGELIRLLLGHPKVEVTTVTSRKYAGDFVFGQHPNLRGITKLKFVPFDVSQITKNSDLVFTALPHGASLSIIPELLETGLKIIDMSADFRLENPNEYDKWYGWSHSAPDLLKDAVYGLPELHRQKIRNAQLIACPGCMATSTILGLAPLIKPGVIENERIITDVKIGSSGAGNSPTIATHHAERSSGIRPYKPVMHRHIAEIEQELGLILKSDKEFNQSIKVGFSAHAVNIVRGILSTSHVFYDASKEINEKTLFNVYRTAYKNEPFVRLITQKVGIFRLPDPKIIIGTNYCDVGFQIDDHMNRIVVLCALDNLVKGSAGNAVQCMNIMCGFPETAGLEFPGYYPL